MKRWRRLQREKTQLPKVDINEEMSTLSQRIDWGLRQLNVPSTWSVTKGKGITVMVIDTGHPVHPDIGDNAIPERIIFQMNQLRMKWTSIHCTGIICAKDNETEWLELPEAKCISVH